ncbi:MAG: homocysteine S-methyltransferase [Lactococcus chungangensis]|uniref:Homocysteine S-methyltransferase n=2 Tax=Pseudolactococcus chungangensis CAU 28 = DSM 22330 TaxID=1122154 RepID=A0A1K2HCL0_9LACT|nr:homocysteine S-methyltransferase [Lactococcus chungangensis]SFZ74281.1 homocysteine S-methyltransferase [Lactococcus chungangensis CAU 28 = DSM 22330]
MTFQQWINEQDIVILDGSMSRLLEEQGLEINHRLWTALALVEQPEAIYQVHKQYFDAGANVAITASYQATVKSFEDVGYSEKQAIAYIERSVTLAKKAKQDSKGGQAKWIAGSIGPYGAYLSDGSEYTGAYQISDYELKDFHEERIKALIASGVDVLAIETIPRLDELRVILNIIAVINFPVWVSISLKDTAHLANGDSLADFQQLVEQDQNVIAYGINCVSPQLVAPVIENLSVAATKPLVAYPNSGAIFDAVTKTWSEEISVEQVFSTDARCWHQKGAKLIGGCCCSTEHDIARLARTFDQAK